MAKNAGLSSAEIDAAATDGPVSGINPEYVLVCKATDELSKSGTLRDETLRELLDRYGETISRKIVLMIGWFNIQPVFKRVPGLDSRAKCNRALREPDLHVFAKLFEDCLKRSLEAQAFSGREIGGDDDVLDFLVGHLVDVDLTRQPAS
jgi:hypothetical protein